MNRSGLIAKNIRRYRLNLVCGLYAEACFFYIVPLGVPNQWLTIPYNMCYGKRKRGV